MEKDFIKNKYLETLKKEEQQYMCVLSIICVEGISRNVVYNVLTSDNPIAFNSLIDRLSAIGWLCCDQQTINCERKVADAILDIMHIDEDTVRDILSSLKKYIVIQPLDDMLSRQQYFVVSRLFLTYIKNQWNVLKLDNCTKQTFIEVVIAFSANAELSYFGNKRQPVRALEERADFALLDFSKQLSSSKPDKGITSVLLGKLYTNIFRYEEAKAEFGLAERYIRDYPELLFEQAIMYENLGIYGKAFLYAYRAFLQNEVRGRNDNNIEVCLYLSYLCAVSGSLKSCKYWRTIACSKIGNRIIPFSHIFTIILNEIEALLHVKDKVLASQILDSTELELYRLYGGSAPEMSRLAYIRSLVDGEAGLIRRGIEHYQQYVRINHFNYGFSVADTICLYSEIIDDNIYRGNNATANIYSDMMRDLLVNAPSIAPGVRLSQVLVNCSLSIAEENYRKGRAYLEMAYSIYEDELKVNEDVYSAITSIFHNGIVPKSVLMIEEINLMTQLSIEISLGEERIDETKEKIRGLVKREKDSIDCLRWNIQMGRVLIHEGIIKEGLKAWRKTLKNTPKASKFEIAKEIAEWARCYELLDEAIVFYEEALQDDAIVYGKTCELADALRGYAEVLEQRGVMGKTEEPWKQAMLLMRSMDDDDGLALLYYSWGLTKQGDEAERLFKKAIELWKPEQRVYDETLSKMYYNLCRAQTSQGKHEEAKNSARKAVKLFPTEFPPEMIEGIKAYL